MQSYDYKFDNQQKTIKIVFANWCNYEITNPLQYGNIGFIFQLYAIRKAIKHFIGFLDYSKVISFKIYDAICGIEIGCGKVYTKDGKIKFTF